MKLPLVESSFRAPRVKVTAPLSMQVVALTERLPPFTGRPAVQAAVCPGDGHHAARMDRDTATINSCSGLVNFQRAMNICTAAGNCIVSILNDQLAAALDRGTPFR